MDVSRLSPFEAFDLAVTRAGGQSALARICGCTPGNINQLLQKQRQLPAEHVLDVEAATGVSRHDLRPDIYPRGLQDDAPFRPDILELGEFDQLVADDRREVSQPPQDGRGPPEHADGDRLQDGAPA